MSAHRYPFFSAATGFVICVAFALGFTLGFFLALVAGCALGLER